MSITWDLHEKKKLHEMYMRYRVKKTFFNVTLMQLSCILGVQKRYFCWKMLKFYMRYTWVIHELYMRYTWDLHECLMYFSCTSHVTLMYFTNISCNSHVTLMYLVMYLSCMSHVMFELYMRVAWVVHENCMRITWVVHESCMSTVDYHIMFKKIDQKKY